MFNKTVVSNGIVKFVKFLEGLWERPVEACYMLYTVQLNSKLDTHIDVSHWDSIYF